MQARLTGSAAAPDLDARLMLDKICFPDSVYQPVACTLTARLPARAQTLLVDLQTQGLGAEGLKGSLSLPVRYGPNGPSLDWRGACSGELACVCAAAGVTPSCAASLSFTTGLWMVCASSLAFSGSFAT